MLVSMSKTLIVAGYGPGISHAVAERFAAQGFSLALVARNADKLASAVAAFEKNGGKAVACPADLSDLGAVRSAIRAARAALGPITVLHWNVATALAGDLLTARPEELTTTLTSGAVALVAAVQEVLADLRAQRPQSAVLVTNGGFGAANDHIDQLAVTVKQMGLSVGNAAKHKLARVLGVALAQEDIYLGEVMVNAVVKHSAWDRGEATLEAATVAERFFALYTTRSERFASLGS